MCGMSPGTVSQHWITEPEGLEMLEMLEMREMLEMLEPMIL